MTDQTERFDRFSAGYARWWAPVLAPAVAELLDAAQPSLAGGERLIDIGTGTGQLALGAIARWPGVSVVGADASAGMAGVADAEADRLLSGAERGRFRSVVAFADTLPFGDREFDGALSSFVFQLVPNRARALREARRVLRPGATLAYVSWLEDDRLFAPMPRSTTSSPNSTSRSVPATVDRATSRRWNERSESCGGPGSRT